MDLHLTPELEQRLGQVAAETHRSFNELAQGAMESFLDEYEEMATAVKESDEQFGRGQFLSHEDVVSRFTKHFGWE